MVQSCVTTESETFGGGGLAKGSRDAPAGTDPLIAGQDGAMPKSAEVAVCPDSTVGDSTVVYRLRVVINGVSPLIWRRLLVRTTATIAQLHTILQTVFGWGGEHLHRFVIHGTEYGISSVGGPGFRENARTGSPR
jgi:hypothetical protein